MGAFADYFDAPQAAPQATPEEAPGEFTKSLRAGAYGAGSQLQSAAGLTAEALGFDEFAKNRAASAAALQAQAQENAPRIGSYKQVLDSPTLRDGLRNAGDYVTGLVGSSLPVMAAGVAGGLATGGAGAVPAMLGAAAATAPFEIGDVIQKQNADPEAMKATPGVRLRDAALAGGASALAQGVVPGMLAGKLAGRAGASAAGRSVKDIVAHNAMAIPVEGVAEGAGEAIKQFGANQDKPLDWEAIKENAVGGAAAGGAFGTVGAGADLARSGTPYAGAAIKNVATSINERLAQAKAAATQAADTTVEQTPKQFTSVMDDLRSMVGKSREAVDDGVDKLRDGTPFGDLKDFATEQGQAVSDSAAVKKMQEYGEQMLNSAGISPERRQQVSEAMANAGDRASQVAMAGLKTAFDAGERLVSKAAALRKSFDRRDVDADATEITTARIGNGEITDVTPVKKSNDFSGINKTLADALAPLLAARQPELLNQPAALADIADGARQAAMTMPTNQVSSNTMFALIDTLGADTAATLKKAFDAVGDKDPAKAETFYTNLNEIAELQKRSATLEEFLGGALVPESQGLIRTGQMADFARALVARARGEGIDANAGPQQRAAADREFRDLMAEHFGDKADAVSLKIEKEAKLSQKGETAKEGEFDEEGNMVQREALEVIRKGRGPKNEPVMDPALFKSRQMPGQNYAAQYIEELQAKYPDYDVRFEKEEGTDGMGHVVAEKAADPESFSDADLQGMKLDTKKYGKSKDRINVGDMALDTKRIAKAMQRLPRPDGQTQAERLKQTFVEGVARLTARFGAIDIPDTAVIGQVAGKDFTFGEAKALDVRSDGDKAYDEQTQELNRQRKEYRGDNGPVDRARVAKEAKELSEGRQLDKDRELARDPDAGRDTQDELERDPGKDDQIAKAAKLKPDDLVNKSNMDGSPRFTSDKNTVNINYLKIAVQDWAQGNSAPAKTIAARTEVLIKNFGKMAEADQRRLASLGGDAKIPAASAAESSSIVNALARKYKDVIVVPAPKALASKREAAAKEKTAAVMTESQAKDRLDWFINPPEDYDTKKARQYLADAETQLKDVVAEKKTLDEMSDEWEKVDDLRFALQALIKKAKSVIEGDESLADVEGTPSPKSLAAKKAALLAAASSSDPSLLKELATSSDAKALQRAAGVLPESQALDAANARLSELVQDPDVAYSMQTNGTGSATAQQRADVAAYLDKVLGKRVNRAWANIPHAGDFDSTQNLIRLSVHALDPLSTAHHEALHALFDQLRKTGSEDITRVLEKAASTEHYLKQMQAIFANEPAVLAQLADPEERAAYMYQLWAAGKLQVGPQVNTLFGKIAAAIRKVLGLWSNDERALHILDYFNSGKYLAAMNNPSAVRQALMQPGTNAAFEQAKALTEPLIRFADAVVSTGSARLRDAGIPALSDLADKIKRDHTDASGKDQGFIAAARIESTKRRTAMGVELESYTPEQLREALEMLQSGVAAPSPEARLAVRSIKGILRDTRNYMVSKGVDVGDLGPDYFPRVWNSHYISKHAQEFREMIEPYIRSGEFKGTADEFIQFLSTREGNEFGVETRQPGMQFQKSRDLSFIKAEDAAAFLTKDLFGTMNSYINQAARRAEWHQRLGGGKLEALLAQAKTQGATTDQLLTAEKYLAGIDGTLGDDLNPTLRRLYGNMIVYQNIRLLPLAMFSSVVDPMGVLVRGGTVSDAWSTFTRGVKDIPKTFGKGKPGTDEATRLAELVGVVDSAMMASTIADVYTQGMVGGFAQKANNAFFKYNLMEGMNRSFRVGASEAAMSFIARHADGKASPHSKRWMAELALQSGDVVALPGGGIALTMADGLTHPQVVRVHAAINQWVDGAVLRPDAADKPIWMNDPHYALISHLKQFVYTFQKTILGRVVHEAKYGNYTPVMAMASYVPVMMAADFMKGALQGGGDQPEWKKGWGMSEYVGYGVQRAGLLGVGQFGMDAAEDVQRGGIGAGALVGPTIEQFVDAIQVLGGRKQFGPVLLDALPANALYKEVAKSGPEE